MKPLDMYSNSSQLHLISGIFGVSRFFYYFFWNCWTGHLHKVKKTIFIVLFWKLRHLPIVLQLWSAIDLPSKFFSHMNFMKTSFSCCIKLLIWTWLEFFNLIQNGQNSFNQFVLIPQLHIIIMLSRYYNPTWGNKLAPN